MRKNLSKVVSMVLTVFFLFSIIPMTPVFAAPSGYTAPLLSEKFDSVWPVNALTIPTTSGEVDFYNGWKLETTANNVVNTTMTVKNIDGVGNVLSFEKSAYTDGQSGDPDYRLLKKPLIFDEETDVATIEFKVRRMEIETTSLILCFNDTDFFQFNLRSAYIIRRTSSANPGFKGGMVQQPVDTWHSFLVKLDYNKNIMDIYLNGTRMTPYSNTKSSTEYSDGNMPFSVAFPLNVEAGTSKSFPDFAIGIRSIQNNKAADAEIQLTDIVVNEYSNEQIAEEEARKEAEAWAKVTDAVDNSFAYLDGVKLDNRVASIADALAIDSDLQTILDQADATLVWSSDKTNISVSDGTVTHPVEDEEAVAVALTATVTNGTSTTQKSYTVNVLPAKTIVYEDLETYLGDSDYLRNKSWTTTSSGNVTASVVSESAGSTNNAISLVSVPNASYSMLEGFQTAVNYGGGSSGGTEISFHLKRVNEAAKKLNLHIQNNATRRMAINFDLVTGRVTFPKVSISGTDTVAVTSRPEGSIVYSPDMKNLAIGEGVDVRIVIPNLQGVYGKSVMIYIDGKPCLYENAVTDAEPMVYKDQPMLAQPVVSAIWVNNTVKQTVFSVNPADNTPGTGGEAASFLLDDIMLRGFSCESAENRNYKALMSVLQPKFDKHSTTIASPEVINSVVELPTEVAPAKSVRWEADVVQDNKIILPDAEDLTEVTLTAIITSENAQRDSDGIGNVAYMTYSWTIKVAPKLMAKVTDATVESGQLTSITMNNLCTLPEGSKLLIGVYDRETSLYKNFKLVDVTDEDIITLDTPLAVGANDTVKAFVWNINTITPMAVSFSK